MDRPGWAKLEAAIRLGKVSAVVVWRLDRLGRTASGLTALFDDLRERKVNLVSMKEGLDLATPAGRLMANMLASVAQYETEVRGERVRAGQQVAKANGKRWGGSQPGTRKKVTTTQEKAIHQMKAGGESIASISRALSLSRPTIYSVLEKMSPAGQILPGWEVVAGMISGRHGTGLIVRAGLTCLDRSAKPPSLSSTLGQGKVRDPCLPEAQTESRYEPQATAGPVARASGTTRPSHVRKMKLSGSACSGVGSIFTTT